MTKIYIDAGHGGNDPGASGNGLREKDLTLTIAKKVQALLKDYATVRMSRTTDKTLSLTQRTKDRKSTRLNSSHVAISYAVFCLKKKKQHYKQHTNKL